ncbi:hypothetical protein FB45DRAFT_901255 [Roridomyces roridus]|uniref:MYND-type domain-containing protein n=1 Tax=Roridomyces roridus TaxID=1738132 RepID=A0AAD7C8S6_9AGAR|nr:hypothetical protein FB45DRAFT_901255 [Roridomyces roridus]
MSTPLKRLGQVLRPDPQPDAPATQARPPPPNKHTDKVAWNARLEEELELKYSSGSTPTAEKSGKQAKSQCCHDHGFDAVSPDIGRILDALVREEIVLANWKALSVVKKRELILEGLYRGSCACPRESSRLDCPELRIEGLTGDGEYNLINLLKQILARSPTRNLASLEIFEYTHPAVDHQYKCSPDAPETLKASLKTAELSRTFCIVSTLIGILQAYKTEFPTNASPKPRDEVPKASEEKKPDGGAKSPQVDSLRFKNLFDNSERCKACHKKLNDNFKWCTRCQVVLYCSSECQEKDASAHKKVCEKENSDKPDATPTFIGCPAPANGYVRSPALWRQIWHLSKPELVSLLSSYHFDITPGRAIPLVFDISQRDPTHIHFHIARKRAMATGDLSAIYMMCALAIRHFEQFPSGRSVMGDLVRRQFEKEYDVVLTPEAFEQAGEYEPPTDKEITEELIYLMLRQFRADRVRGERSTQVER